MNLNQIQTRIQAAKSTQKITSALKLISATDYPRAVNRKKNYDLFIESFEKVIKTVVHENQGYFQQYRELIFDQNKTDNLLIALFSKRGLCGDFNKKVEQRIYGSGVLGAFESSAKTDYIVIGKRGFSIMQRLSGIVKVNFELLKEFPLDSYEEITKIEAFLKENISAFVGKYKNIYIVYNKYKSLLSNHSNHCELFSKIEKLSAAQKSHNESFDNLIVDKNDFFNTFDKFFVCKILKAVYNSMASEVSSRYVTTDQANTNSKKQIERLQLKFNKLRQASITKEISELSAASANVDQIE